MMDVVIAGCLGLITGIVVGMIYSARIFVSILNKTQKELDKIRQLFLLMTQWVKIKQKGKNLRDSFEQDGIKRIAIYGMGVVGERLLAELKDGGIEVVYGIDTNAKNIHSALKIITPSEQMEPVDAIVITAVSIFEEIEDMLLEKGVRCRILSIEDLLFDI